MEFQPDPPTDVPGHGGVARVAIQGSLEEAALPDVVQLLALGRKTGRLSLVQGPLRGEIFLDGGRVCYAYVASRRDRLGDMLVRTGRITQQQLNDAITQGKSGAGAKRVSRILLESGQVERSEMERYFRAQVEEAVYFMFTWRTGTFEFNSKIRPDDFDIAVSIDPEGLLLEGARRVDEWSVIGKKIPSFDLVFRLDRPRLKAAAVTLTAEQQQIVPLIDGSRDVAGIIELAGMSEFDAGKALYGLITAGFAHVVERRAVVRHLEYRELLAYVVREAEYADPEARRAAARHIADCASCTGRLKTIHVRRTGTVSSATLPPLAMPPAAPAAAPMADDGDDAIALEDEVPVERRSGGERREEERRLHERRTARSTDWERPGVDRRSGADRRGAGRRVTERRLTPTIGGPGGSTAALASGPGPTSRTTGPRRVPALEVTRGGRQGAQAPRTIERRRGRPGIERAAPPRPRTPAAPAAPASSKAAVEVTPGAGTMPEVAAPPAPPSAPEGDVKATSATAPPDAKVRPVPASIRPHPRPEPGHGGAKSADIEWLVSPGEANDLLRTSRTGLPPLPKAGQAPAPAPLPAVPVGEVSPAAAEAPARSEHAQSGPARSRGRKLVPIAAAAIAIAGLAWMTLSLAGRGGRGEAAGTATLSGAVAAQGPANTPLKATETSQPVTLSPPTATAPPATSPRPAGGTESRRARPAPITSAGQPAARAAAPAVAVAPAVTEAPPPAVATIRGVVRDAGSNAPLAGAEITIPGTAFRTTSDAAGTYALADVPAGPVTMSVTLGDRPAASRQVTVRAGMAEPVDVLLEGVPAPPAPAAPPAPTLVKAAAPDEELASGWIAADLASASNTLGVPLAMIPGLWIESVATPEGGARPRVRIAQLTPSGARIVLTETRSGAPVPTENPRVTALRIIPASQTYPVTTGTASFGNLLVTAKADLSGDSLRTLLAKLVVAQPAK